jgi:very-short-patch-repair endonuclease
MGVVSMPRLERRSLNFSRELRSAMTDAERKLWRELRLSQLGAKFRRQHPVGKYIVDFASIRARVCIELDGAQHATQILRDEARSAFLRSEGYMVLRFSDREVLTSMESVKEAIWNAVHQSRPPPSQPSP